MRKRVLGGFCIYEVATREQDKEITRPMFIRIDVRRYVDALGSCPIQYIDDRLRSSEQLAVCNFDVRDL